jgi:hypothetical protein
MRQNSAYNPPHMPDDQPPKKSAAAPEPPPPPPVPAGPSEKVYRWVDVYSKISQIAAVFVAAAWAVIVFEWISAPALEPKILVETEVSWRSIGESDVCQANFGVTVKNPGQRSIEIKTAQLVVRLHDLQKVNPHNGKPYFFPDSQEVPTLIDSEELEAIDPPAIDRTNIRLLNSDIVGPYPPGMENSSSQTLLFKKFENALAIIQVDVSGTSRGLLPFTEQEVHNYGYAIARVCEVKSEQPEVKKPVDQNKNVKQQKKTTMKMKTRTAK